MAVTIKKKYMPYSSQETKELLADVEEIRKRSGLVNDSNTITGNNAFASGDKCVASGNEAYAVGDEAKATGNNAHAEGHKTTASGSSSHAEGKDTTASGKYAHAEGDSNTASGNSAHAGGAGSTAAGNNSFAHGDRTETSNGNEVALGKLNKTKNGLRFSVGIGVDIEDFDDPDFPAKKMNAFEVMEDGTMNYYANGEMKSMQTILHEAFDVDDIGSQNGYYGTYPDLQFNLYTADDRNIFNDMEAIWAAHKVPVLKVATPVLGKSFEIPLFKNAQNVYLGSLMTDSGYIVIVSISNSSSMLLTRGVYSKPAAGIPKTDMAEGVKTSLGKADNALQNVTEEEFNAIFYPSDSSE